MAKRVSVAELQAMSRGAAIDETEIIDPVAEDAAATEALRRIGAPVNGIGAVLVTEEPPFPIGSRVVVEIQGHRLEATFLTFDPEGPLGVACGVDVTSSNVNWGIQTGMAWVALDQVSAAEAPVETDFTDADVDEMARDAGFEPRPDEFQPSTSDHLRGLGVERECTAEMSLHMITERVRDAARERLPVDYAPTETDVVHEAERIWVSLDAKRSHTYSVELDGSVRDWRRPDTTPDRGDVTATHTVTDEDPRFSGGGADDIQSDLYAVPTDQQFNGKLYRDAPDLANRAETLIERHGFLSELINCEIRYFWKRKTGVSKGRVKIGYCKRASDLLGHFTGADFIVWLSATTARDGKFTDTQVEAALFHQLLHIGTDDSGNFIFAPHDFEGFGAEIRHYGTWTEDLKLGGTAFVAAHQMGLFDADASPEDDEEDDREEAAQAGYVETPDGAGVLIHADGTALTDDEIEAMERHELADDDDFDDSAIAEGIELEEAERAAAQRRPFDEPGYVPPDDAREDILADDPI